MVVELVPLVAAPPDSEDNNLLVCSRFRLPQAQNSLISKLRRQDGSAFINSVIRDDHHEHSAWAHPSADMFEKQPLHALLREFPVSVPDCGWG
jgi:hypothetical protein